MNGILGTSAKASSTRDDSAAATERWQCKSRVPTRSCADSKNQRSPAHGEAFWHPLGVDLEHLLVISSTGLIFERWRWSVSRSRRSSLAYLLKLAIGGFYINWNTNYFKYICDVITIYDKILIYLKIFIEYIA